MKWVVLACTAFVLPAWADEKIDQKVAEKNKKHEIASIVEKVDSQRIDSQDKNYQSDYGSVSSFGSASGVAENIKQSNVARESLYKVDILQRTFSPWFDWKKDVYEKHGLTLGANAYWLFQGSDDSQSDETTALGGIYRFQGTWSLFARNTGHTGSLHWRVENRSELITDIAPQELSGDLGIKNLNSGFGYASNFDTDIAVLSWVQKFNNDRAGIAVGRLAFDAYLDGFPFQTFSRGFINRSFLVNPTLGTTGIGALGVVVKGFVTDSIWLGAQIHDGNAVNGEFDMATFHQSNWLKSAEIGWASSIERRNLDRVQLTYWEKDARPQAGIVAGQGWALSATYQIGDRWQPFLRLGHSDGGAGVAAENAVSVGLELQRVRDQVWSIGAGWSEPSTLTYGAGLDNEKVFETSYKIQLSQNFSVTGDFQYIENPAANQEENAVIVLGLRAILTL